jgi:RNA polymerase sigma factor (sigma-70 family)
MFEFVMGETEKHKRFQEVIELHKGILFKVARTYCKSEEDRQDLMQETSIQIWRSLDRYDDKYKISTWLYRIALNVAISFYRKNAKRQEATFPLDIQVLHIYEVENPEKQEQLKLLEGFINELNDLDKALMLLYLEDKTHSEISDVLGISQSNVGTKISRIKDKLKKRFSQINK